MLSADTRKMALLTTPIVVLTGLTLVTLYPENFGIQKESFPIQLPDIFGTNKGFTPEAPPIEKPGYETPPFDDMSTLFNDNVGITAAEEAAISDRIQASGILNPVDGQRVVIALYPDNIAAEIKHAVDLLNNTDATWLEVRAQMSPAAARELEDMVVMQAQGQNFLVVNKSTSVMVPLFGGIGRGPVN